MAQNDNWRMGIGQVDGAQERGEWAVTQPEPIRRGLGLAR